MNIDIAAFKPKKPAELGIEYTNRDDFQKIITLHHGRTAAEHKYDGNGLKFGTAGGIQLYSLDNTQWNPDCFPELHDDFKRLPKIKAIGELVGRPTHEGFTNLEEFSAVQKRPKVSYDAQKIKDLAHDKPLEIRLYDILEVNGKNTMALPLTERRAILVDMLRKSKAKYVLPTDQRIIDDAAALQQATLDTFDAGLEGFVVKDLTTPYVFGSRSKDWLKLKKKPTFDLLVLGLYQTPERLEAGWPCANVLGGVRNERTGKLETLSKITVPSKALAEDMYGRVKPWLAYTWDNRKHFWENDHTAQVSHDPSVVYNPDLAGSKALMKKIPFAYVRDPLQHSFVIEAKCLDVSSGEDTWHSCGLDAKDGGKAVTLRQAVFERFRDDKTPAQATTTKYVMDYYNGV